MLDTILRRLGAIRSPSDHHALYPILASMGDQHSSVSLATAGLVISTDTFTAKIGGADYYAVATGRLVKIASGTAMPSLTTAFNIAQNFFNVVVFTVNNAGTVQAGLGTPAATLGGVIFPVEQLYSATIGFVILNPTTAPFVGGSTALSSTAANAVYVSPVGSFEPTILVS